MATPLAHQTDCEKTAPLVETTLVSAGGFFIAAVLCYGSEIFVPRMLLAVYA